MILTENYAQEIASVKSQLDYLFKINDLGQLKIFLGLKVARSNKGIFLNQRKYTLALLDAASLLGYELPTTTMYPQIKLHSKESPLLEDISMYRRLTGQLIYQTNTRPNICFCCQSSLIVLIRSYNGSLPSSTQSSFLSHS